MFIFAFHMLNNNIILLLYVKYHNLKYPTYICNTYFVSSILLILNDKWIVGEPVQFQHLLWFLWPTRRL